jgi:hypothetical protein
MTDKQQKNNNQLNGYELSRNWFDWCYENPDLINPNHAALYFFIIEHYNRLGWKEKFGLPYQMAMDAMGIKSYKTYKKAFDDLVKWGFIKIIKESKNQYSANVIALVKNTKANTKALTKASTKHALKHVQSTYQGTGDIDKLRTIEPNNQEPRSSKSHSGANAPEEKKELPFWKNFISVWNEWYKTKFNGSYAFMKKDFAQLKRIYIFLEKRAQEKKFEFTEENLLAEFKFFLNKAWEKDDWLRQNFSIPNVLSQFNQIANGQSNSKNKPRTGSDVSTGSILSKIAAMPD